MQVEAYIGEIRLFGFGWAPDGWAQCNGQLLLINENQALYSLLGTMYGGDARSTFGVPDLRGRAVIGYGQSPKLSYSYQMSQWGGEETVTLGVAQIPAHNHTLIADGATGTLLNPQNNYLAEGAFPGAAFYSADKSVAMNQGTIGNTGGSQPHENRSPYLALNYCIALQGIYPQRPD
ncbi:Tail Collar domain protein [Chloroherpeton thalassium ATCC 35110]|uniref:Tail Collar domain protein n=1 Tax=Chloroherpeton thalassium (strain ATCC 35110 / GB-78) TaxID=517418 RepID=B3QRT1_CHLT3|nr:tail fiber protein [Chloroherpeton thalassium]ACF13884.1 Tail Collar domain protein [Chloroherpeton thalassium ATCC 35110]